MIDYVKLVVSFLNNYDITQNLMLEEHVQINANQRTGEQIMEKYSYKSMTIKVYESGRTIIQGSLHKLYNDIKGIQAPNFDKRGFNGNEFSYKHLLFTIRHLAEEFNIDIEKTKIDNIEFGLNLSHEWCTEDILNGLLLHTGKTFDRPLCTYKKLQHEQYRIKCYDKAFQYGMDGSIIRIELSYHRMLELNRVGLFFLSDLLIPDTVGKLKSILIKKWDEVLFYDYSIDESGLNLKDKNDLANYKNETYWKRIEPNRRHRPKLRLKKLTEKYSQMVKHSIRELISSRWDALISGV